MKRNNLLIYLSYAAVYIVWGSTYFFIKIAVETIPPMTLVACRWGLGGLIFLGYYYLRNGFKLPSWKEAGSAFLMGMLLILIPNSLVCSAERRLDSYLTALVLSMAPVPVVFFDRFLLGKKISIATLAGITAGILGIAILVYNGSSPQLSLSKELCMLFVVVAAFGLGTSIGHRVNSKTNTVANTGYQMALSGLAALAWTLFTAPSGFGSSAGFSARSVAALFYLATVGSAAYGAYNYLIKHEPAARVASYALVNPVIAVALGLLIGKEAPVRYAALGVPVVMAGLGMMMYGERFAAYIRKLPAGVSGNY